MDQSYLRYLIWLNGYRRRDAYHSLEREVPRHRATWNVGVGATASFTRAIASIDVEGTIKYRGPFDPVIKVELMKEPTEEEAARGRSGSHLSIEEHLRAAVAKELGLLDQEEYSRRKEADDDLRYYSYGMDNYTWLLSDLVSRTKIMPRISEKLLTKRYLLVVNNLYDHIDSSSFSETVGLPPPSWRDSNWLISTTSREVCDRSKSVNHEVLQFSSEEEILMLILSSLHQSANYIFNTIRREDEQYWHRVALRCLHSAMLLFPRHPLPPDRGIIHGDGDHQGSSAPSVTSDELIRQWAAQGILFSIEPRVQESIKEEIGSYCDKYDDIYQVGNVILQAFREYSLMKLPFSLATEADAPTETAAQFLASHGLIAERLPTVDKLFDEMQWLEHKKWISLMDNKGWHISSEWLSKEIGGPTTLILRHCSQISNLFSQLDHLLPNLPCIRVLDLSYTILESLPPSIWCLLNLRLLSLRGCRGLKRLCSFSDSERSDLRKNSNKNINLLCFDLSYSDINTFHCDFFQNMPNLQELLLVKCSSLVELPPSIVALSNLTTLELTGTQIKSSSEEIFGKMNKLQSVKLIGNKKLVLLPGSISKAHGLIKLHIEGWESSIEEEIKLDGHPTLQSFSLISAPHVRCISLRGCVKLESVEFKDLGALEDLNLSATAIKELPADIPNMPKLKRLLLMGVPSLRRFPWHKLQRLPDVFCLDECAEGIGNHCDQVAQVCISDSRLFHSFNDTTRDLVRNGRFFQFHVRVAPCNTNIRQLPHEESMLDNKLREIVKKQSTYVDVYSSYKAEEVAIFSPMTVPLRRTGRHVEISAMHRRPDGLDRLLQVTRSISVTCDTSISELNHLSDFDELEECDLQWCHKMYRVTRGLGYQKNLQNVHASNLESLAHKDRYLKNLRNVHASNLKSLAHFYQLHWSIEHPSLSTLEHLHLEYCPRLKDMMPCQTALPCLKTLDILFCYNLKTIFYHYRRQGNSSYQLPRLQTIRLQELPQLQHLHDDDAVIIAPMWKELHVRGCWSLRRLPHLQDQPRMVELNGERSWWGKLLWDSPLHRNSYDHKLTPAFASFDERAEIKSYLR